MNFGRDRATLANMKAQRQFIETDSGVVSYVDVGTGRTALFIHGVGTSGYLWSNVVAPLEGDQRCVDDRPPAACASDGTP